MSPSSLCGYGVPFDGLESIKLYSDPRLYLLLVSARHVFAG
ncbi:MAG: hypothetical protein ABSC76_10390 [Terracidiphilus sp.]